ncbi:serine hydrolase domain-containing protein [Streptomyces sp. NPDC051018]|uniref:serine hydrolase domain-containing protein n=1 Tax=Streptomyces sp. NPDC051018 TaxID=3365639 RepID=UPI0037A43803
MNDYEQYLGTWTGPAPATVGGPVRITVRGVSASGAPEVVLGFEALGGPTPLTGVTVADGRLTGTMGPTLLSLERTGHTLKGSLTSSVLPGLAFELRRGHPMDAVFASPRRTLAADARPDRQASPTAAALTGAVEDGRLPWVDSLHLIEGGETVLEEYFYGRTPDGLHSLQSATKSITALLFGTLVAEGAVDLDVPAGRYLKHREGTRWIDEAYGVTSHELLSMSAGLDWDEVERPYSDPDNDATRMNGAPDWIEFVLNTPLGARRRPGDFVYQSGLSLLMGELVRAVTGLPVPEAARRRLFEPLGIERFHWMTMPDGTCHTGGGLWLTPRDFAKFGRLVLDGGVWEGRRVLPAEWIRRSVTEQSAPAGPHPLVPRMAAYGYQWWLLDTPAPDGGTVRSASALGHGGQIMHILPDTGTAVVATAHDWLGASELTDALLDLVLHPGDGR